MEILLLAIYAVVFLYSVILHEIAHGFVANYFGDDTARVSGRLSLNPIVHIDPFGSLLFPILLYVSTGFAFGYAKPVPVNPYRLKGGKVAYRWVTLAGILTNFSLALFSALILKLVGGFGAANAGVVFFQLIFILNVVLAVFNAFPFPGFDGFNFLTTFDWFAGLVSQTPIANPLFLARYGIMVSLLLVFLAWPLISQVIIFVIGFLAGAIGITPLLTG